MLTILSWTFGIIAGVCTVLFLLGLAFGMIFNRIDDLVDTVMGKGFGILIISWLLFGIFGIWDNVVHEQNTINQCKVIGGKYQVIGETIGAKGQTINIYGCVK